MRCASTVLLLAGMTTLLLAASVGCTNNNASTGNPSGPPQDLTVAGKATKNAEGVVTGLRLYGKRIRDVDVAQLGEFPDLATLTIQECAVTDQAAEAIGECEQLHTLKLLNVPVSDVLLASCSTSLRDLQVARTKVTGSGLKRLAELEKLALFGQSFTKEGLATVAQLTSLIELDLDSDSVSLSDLPTLSPLTSLRVFRCGKTQVGPSGLRCIDGLADLRELHLSADDVTDATIPVLNTLQSLEYLQMDGAAVTDLGLGSLALPKLRFLSISNCKSVTDRGLSQLQLPELRDVNLSDSGVEGRDLTGLKSLKKLEKATLSGEQFKGGDESLEAAKEVMPTVTIEVLRG